MSENGVLSKFWVQELTRPAFEDWLENEENPVVVIGIGSIEQHGPHLPLGMDSLAVKARIHKVASRTNSVCVHPCWPGYSPHHMGFAGTITFSWETLMGVLMDTIGSLAYHGVKRFVLMNGHGGNTATMNLVAQTAKREFDVNRKNVNNDIGTYTVAPMRQALHRRFSLSYWRCGDYQRTGNPVIT